MEPISREQLKAIEKYLDKMYAAIDVDIAFTKHFFDRLNDPRNGIQIGVDEIAGVFTKFFDKYGQKLASMADKAKAVQAVITDISTDINVPFTLKWDDQNNEFDLVSKTVMRKQGFTVGRERRFKVEEYQMDQDIGLTLERFKKALNECDVEPTDTTRADHLIKLAAWINGYLAEPTTEPEAVILAIKSKLETAGILIPTFEFPYEEALEDQEGTIEIECTNVVNGEDKDLARGGLYLVIDWEMDEVGRIEMTAMFQHGNDLDPFEDEDIVMEGKEESDMQIATHQELAAQEREEEKAKAQELQINRKRYGTEALDEEFEVVLEDFAALIPKMHNAVTSMMLEPEARFILTKLHKSDTFKTWLKKYGGQVSSEKAHRSLMAILRDKFSIKEKAQIERLIVIIQNKIQAGEFEDGTAKNPV